MRPSSEAHDRHETVSGDSPQPSTTVRRVTVPEAAEILGITTDAVRSRMRRGKLRREEGEHGTVYVLLDGQDGHTTVEDGQRTGNPTGGNGRETVEDGPLVEELRDRVRSLETQLEHERQANSENRHIIARLVLRVPELEAAQEPREAPVSASDPPGNGNVPEHQDGPQERRSWWRRIFEG